MNFLALISLLVAGSFQSGCTELTTATNTELRMCLVFIRLADCLTLNRYCRLYLCRFAIMFLSSLVTAAGWVRAGGFCLFSVNVVILMIRSHRVVINL